MEECFLPRPQITADRAAIVGALSFCCVLGAARAQEDEQCPLQEKACRSETHSCVEIRGPGLSSLLTSENVSAYLNRRAHLSHVIPQSTSRKNSQDE